jgi:hypothetical protein
MIAETTRPLTAEERAWWAIAFAVRLRGSRRICWQTFLSDVLNPRVGIFFLAFVPQFVDRGSGSPARRFLLLGVTVCMIALAINIPLVVVAARVGATASQRHDRPSPDAAHGRGVRRARLSRRRRPSRRPSRRSTHVTPPTEPRRKC